MAALFAAYLTDPDGAFAEDYAAGWGGYPGPFVTNVTVTLPDGTSVASDPVRWPAPGSGNLSDS